MNPLLSEMKMKEDTNNLTRLINRYIKLHKPNGVSDIKIDIDPLNKKEYYIRIEYIVPEDSEYLNITKEGNNWWSEFDNYHTYWDDQIKNSIQNMFDIKVYISSSGMKSEKFKY
jgi:hypothetical protein